MYLTNKLLFLFSNNYFKLVDFGFFKLSLLPTLNKITISYRFSKSDKIEKTVKVREIFKTENN